MDVMTNPAHKNNQEKFQISCKKESSNLFIYLSGEFKLKNLTAFDSDIRREISGQKFNSITIDFSDVHYLDSAAALALVQIEKDFLCQNIQCQFVNLNSESRKIFIVIHGEDFIQTPCGPAKSADIWVERRGLHSKAGKSYEGFIRNIGRATMHVARDFVNLATFVGELMVALVHTMLHPRSLRGKDVLFYMRRAGVEGLPIVALIGALIGLIIAFMSFLQLKQIGANIYVPALVSFAMVRELGPIMTAILVAGRSGSAFAAEIGTMVVNEEVDALHTMGFDPIRFLAIPKVLATVIVVPVLTIYADLFGILGGMVIGFTSLDLTVKTYFTQSMKTIQVFDVVSSLIKSAVFAVLVSAIGCQRGFLVRSGAQDVGKFTTSAVVAAIFMIVVADSIFAVMLYYIKS
jgi:phospholipid/cholesterol/gamma-HCH transport system permease protein